MTPPTEAQAPTPEPSELRNLLERAKPHASSHALVYGHRGIIGELIDALEARALSPSADTRMGEVDIRKQAISLLDQHSNYMNGISHGQRHIPTEFALRAVEAALSTTRLAASSREGGENLRSALEAAVRDLEATYEAAKSGKPIETSIGQFGRLSRMKAALASPAPMPEDAETKCALELFRTIKARDGRYVAVKVDGPFNWTITEPRTQEALLEALETEAPV